MTKKVTKIRSFLKYVFFSSFNIFNNFPIFSLYSPSSFSLFPYSLLYQILYQLPNFLAFMIDDLSNILRSFTLHFLRFIYLITFNLSLFLSFIFLSFFSLLILFTFSFFLSYLFPFFVSLLITIPLLLTFSSSSSSSFSHHSFFFFFLSLQTYTIFILSFHLLFLLTLFTSLPSLTLPILSSPLIPFIFPQSYNISFFFLHSLSSYLLCSFFITLLFIHLHIKK